MRQLLIGASVLCGMLACVSLGDEKIAEASESDESPSGNTATEQIRQAAADFVDAFNRADGQSE